MCVCLIGTYILLNCYNLKDSAEYAVTDAYYNYIVHL